MYLSLETNSAMDSKINTIGLTIWGYKQGCKVLASQGVNFQAQEVRDRLKDISAFIRIHTPRVDFYTLQFTQNYKIYTQYRSSKEVNGQSGVFIAISLYIPHFLQWRGVRLVLNLLMDMYFAEHIDYQTNMPQLNVKEDIYPYFNLLRSYERQLVDDPEARSCVLQLPYSPKVFTYRDLYEVDKYFNMPYQPEFSDVQDVVFLRKEFVDDPRAYSIDFLFPEYTLQQQDTTAKPSATTKSTTEVSRFSLRDANLKILAFMKNGKDVSLTYKNEAFSEDDMIELLLEKSRYQEMFSFHDTLKKGVKKGVFKKTQDGYALDNITFADKTFKVYVQATQKEYAKYVSFLSLESNNFKVKTNSDSKGYYFLLKGEEAHNIFSLNYNGIVFKSNYMVDDREPLMVGFEKYHFTIVSKKKATITLKINSILFSNTLRSDAPIDIVLPEHLYHFEFENQETKRVINISKSGEINFDVAAKNFNPQMIASQSPTNDNKQLSVIDESLEDDEVVAPKSRFLWLKIASIIVFVLLLVGVGYWFILPMLKDPVKAYVMFSSDSKIKNISFLTKIDERTYEIDDVYIRLKKSFPIAETKLVLDFDEEGKDTLVLSQTQLSNLAQMVANDTKDTLKIEVLSPARYFLFNVSQWKETHADPKGTLFLAEARKRNFITEGLRSEYEKAVWDNFLKDFDYSAYNSEQVDSILSPYLKGGGDELLGYQNDLQQIIEQTKAREEGGGDTTQEGTVATEAVQQPITPKAMASTTPRNSETQRKASVPTIPNELPAAVPIPAKENRASSPLDEPRESKTITRRIRNTPKPVASNPTLTNEVVTDLKRFNLLGCSEEVVNRVKANIKKLDSKDWSLVLYELNQERKEIEERINQYSMFFTALKNGTSIDNIKTSSFGGQSNLINYLKKNNNYNLVKGKANLKTFANIRQAIIDTGVDPKTIQ